MTHFFTSKRLMPSVLLAGLLVAGSALAAAVFDAPDTAYKGQVRLSSAKRGAPLTAGGEVSVSGRGFKPGQKVTLLRGTSVLNPDGAFVADAEGKIQGTFTLPADAAIGTHPIVVTTDAPYNAEVVDLKISPVIPLSGADKFKIAAAKLPPGVYQSAYGARSNAVFVTTTAGRPPEMKSQLLKLDPESLRTIAAITPALAPPQAGGDEEEGGQAVKDGMVFAVYGIAADDASGTVWVTNTRQNTVAVYKQDDLSLVKQFEPQLVDHVRDVAVDEKNGKAYASPFSAPELVVFDARAMTLAKRIPLKTAVRGKVFSPIGLRMDAKTGKLFVVSMTTPEVAVIDTASDTVEKIIPVPGARSLMAVAYDGERDHLYLVGQGSDDLMILDGKTGKLLHDVSIGGGPLSVAYDPVSKLAYVSSRDAGTVTAVDAEGKIVGNLDQSPFPNHVFADGKGGVYSLNKSMKPDDPKGDRITHIQFAR